ncbi:cache domain-containing protein [Dechloromonas denitrificans]|uniref:sensor histidine kinase n=1 Tax=Dechloromonas denitrificans TaxID=281362 RepID=UPI001CF8AA62|nr:cache domain-containing protein [Dechloromonas denitrificans]
MTERKPVLFEPPSRRSVRVRLLLLALLPLGIALPAMVAVLASWGGDYFDRLLVTKVRADLAVAHGYFERVSDGLGRSVEGLAGSARLVRALTLPAKPQEAALADLLDGARAAQRLDFLHFLPVDRSTRLAAIWPVIGAARQGVARTETEIFSADQLRQIDPALAERAVTPLLATANATVDHRVVEARGLLLHTAAPVRDAHGGLRGVLVGGVLLNKNLAFIDRLNAIVYPDGALPLGSAGTATLFLDDVRVATNVRLFQGERAIGTRVSAAVRQAVLDEGRTWLDRAFVVNDWYVSAYEPLLDSHGKRIGMLYVGFLEGPFEAAKRSALGVVVGLFALVMLVAGVFAVLWARRVFKPIERMHATMHAIENGDGDARVGPVGSHDELGIVASHFDRLLDRLQAQATSLKRWGESLDAEVAARTADLEQAVADLKAAQSQLVMNEKLAAIGQLTAGVAHEINNPIAVMQGNLDVLRDILGPAAEPVAPEIKLIHEQVQRIRLIVAKLLQFARPQDYVGYLEPVAPAQLIQDSLVLVGHLLKQGNIAIEQHFDSSRHVLCNRNELQQVLINLLVNAIQAMPEGGVLRLIAEDWDESDMPVGLRLVVADSGAGISDADKARLFKPFFTANKTDGTGLGLWVSQSLIERYGGRITVDSLAGRGTRFAVWLRFEPLAVERPA